MNQILHTRRLMIIVAALLLAAVACTCGPLSGLLGTTPTSPPPTVANPIPTAASSGSGTTATLFDGPSDSVVGMLYGSLDAPVTLIEYLDYSCPHCDRLEPTMERIADRYVPDGTLQIIIRPLTFVSSASLPAAIAHYCADQQGMGWEYHVRLWQWYDQEGGPGGYTPGHFRQIASDLGLDMNQFNRCLDSTDATDEINAVAQAANQSGVTGTPTLFVNDSEVPYTGPDAAYDALVEAISNAQGN